MKKFLSLGVALCTALTFMPVTNVQALNGQATKSDVTFEATNKPGVYYKIKLKEKSLLSFRLKAGKTEEDLDPDPTINLYNAKGKYLDSPSVNEDTPSMENVYNKGTYYINYSVYDSDLEKEFPTIGKITYHIAPLSKAKTINFKKANKGKTGSYYSILYKTKVKGVQYIDLKTNKATGLGFLTGTPLGKNKDPDYGQYEVELENCTAYYYVNSNAKNHAYSFTAKRKVYYKKFPLSFPVDYKVHNIKLNKTYYGHHDTLAEVTNYKFKLKKAKKITVKSSNFKSKRRMFVYNITKKKVFSLSKHYDQAKTFKLKAGTYYLNCCAFSDAGIDVRYHYDFTIKG